MEFARSLDKLYEKLWPGMRIIYIDDNDDDQQALKRILGAKNIFFYPSKKIDMRLIHNMNPDLIILDIGGIEGWEDVAMKYADNVVLFTGEVNGNIPPVIRSVVRDVIDKADMDALVEHIHNKKNNDEGTDTKVMYQF